MKLNLFLLIIFCLAANQISAQGFPPPETGINYSGNTLNGLREGWGILEAPQSKSIVYYEGLWKAGKPVGKFILKFANKEIYYGDLTTDYVLEGKGVLEGGNGNSYIGNFSRGKFNGWGLFYFKSPAQYIFAKFVDGVPLGPGKIFYKGQSTFETSFSGAFNKMGAGKHTAQDGKISYGVIENSKWTKVLTEAQYTSIPGAFAESMVPSELAYQLAFAKRSLDPKFNTILNPFFFKKVSADPPSKWMPYRLFGQNGYMDTKGNVMLRLDLPIQNQVVMTAFSLEGITLVEHYKENFITAGAKKYVIDAEGTVLIPDDMEPVYITKYPLVDVLLNKHGAEIDYAIYDSKKAMYNLKTKQYFKIMDLDGEKGGHINAINSNLFLKINAKNVLLDGNGKVIAKAEMINYLPGMNAFIFKENATSKVGIKDIALSKWLVSPTFDGIAVLGDEKTIIGLKGTDWFIIDKTGKPISAGYKMLFMTADFMSAPLKDSQLPLYLYGRKNDETTVILTPLGKEVINIGKKDMSSQVALGTFIFSEQINDRYLSGLMTLGGKVVLPADSYSQMRIADQKTGLFTTELPKPAGSTNYQYAVFKADGSRWNDKIYSLGLDFKNGHAVANYKVGKGEIVNTAGNSVYILNGYPDSKRLKNGMYYATSGSSNNTGPETQYYVTIPGKIEFKPKNW